MESFTPNLYADHKTPLYQQLYEWIRQQILNGHLQGGEKLPSLRKLSQDLNISKNTILTAYEQLVAEGYIESEPKAGYRVALMHALLYEPRKESIPVVEKTDMTACRYNLAGKGIDTSIFNVKQWSKVTNAVLREELGELSNYGDPQGELELRREIAAYVFENRGIDCTPEQIIIGAGTQWCLSFLCQMLLRDQPHVAMEEPGSNWLRFIFERFGYQVTSMPIRKDGYDIRILLESQANVAFVTPSHQFLKGKNIPAQNRIELLNWAYRKNGLLIEDDYDSEVRFLFDTVAPLKSLDKNDRVVYMGSFSKIFMPTLRLSFMILPQNLYERYRNEYYLYEQTASRIHQKALARFMREGYFESHIRKLKKHYRAKYKQIVASMEKYWGEHVEIIFAKGGLSFMLAINCDKKEEELIEQATKVGVCIRSLGDYYERHMDYHQQGRPKMYLSFKMVTMEEVEEVIKILRDCWFR